MVWSIVTFFVDLRKEILRKWYLLVGNVKKVYFCKHANVINNFNDEYHRRNKVHFKLPSIERDNNFYYPANYHIFVYKKEDSL